MDIEMADERSSNHRSQKKCKKEKASLLKQKEWHDVLRKTDVSREYVYVHRGEGGGGVLL